MIIQVHLISKILETAKCISNTVHLRPIPFKTSLYSVLLSYRYLLKWVIKCNNRIHQEIKINRTRTKAYRLTSSNSNSIHLRYIHRVCLNKDSNSKWSSLKTILKTQWWISHLCHSSCHKMQWMGFLAHKMQLRFKYKINHHKDLLESLCKGLTPLKYLILKTYTSVNCLHLQTTVCRCSLNQAPFLNNQLHHKCPSIKTQCRWHPTIAITFTQIISNNYHKLDSQCKIHWI